MCNDVEIENIRKIIFCYDLISNKLKTNYLNLERYSKLGYFIFHTLQKHFQLATIEVRIQDLIFGIFVPAMYCMRLTGSCCSEANRNRWAYSKYSAILCKKLKGSLKTTGIVILLSSLPMQFFNTDHTLKSLRLNIGTGNCVLKQNNNNMTVHR